MILRPLILLYRYAGHLVAIAALAMSAANARSAQPTPAGMSDEIFRFDSSAELMKVPRSEMKPGMIYLHYSPSHGKQVWSYLQKDGTFWHAFGEGTTQPISQFDMRISRDESVKALTKIDPKLAFDVTSTGSKIFLRLESGGRWRLVRTNSVPSVYDIETGHRWEKHYEAYMPVVHICGDDWQVRNGRYVAPHWDE